jgi:hypothetical protein
MTRYRVAELEGALLDAAVAKALGYSSKHTAFMVSRSKLVIRRVGLAEVERLEGPPRKYTTDDLKAIRDMYRAKAKETTCQQ